MFICTEKKYTYEEYKEKYPNNMICYKDKYYCELEDLLEENEIIDSPIYGIFEDRMEIDIISAIGHAEEDYEDGCFDDISELVNFIKKWNKENGKTYYCVDFGVKIII